jgi:hypothetical protein
VGVKRRGHCQQLSRRARARRLRVRDHQKVKRLLRQLSGSVLRRSADR